MKLVGFLTFHDRMNPMSKLENATPQPGDGRRVTKGRGEHCPKPTPTVAQITATGLPQGGSYREILGTLSGKCLASGCISRAVPFEVSSIKTM